MGNMRYHTMIKHQEVKNTKKIKCPHTNCQITFKTIKQKQVHHDNYDEECKNEKLALLKLLMEMKNCLDSVLKDSDIEPNVAVENINSCSSLKMNYEYFYKKYAKNEVDYYKSILGKSFYKNEL
jgi:hypothetical protein